MIEIQRHERHPIQPRELPLRPRVRGAASLALGAALLLLSLEGFVRVLERRFLFYNLEMARYANELKVGAADPAIGHVHRAGAAAVLMGVPVAINADGLRDDDYSAERNHKRRIVFLGDSLTLGWGVRKEDTFEALLEEALSANAPTEIINFGIGNYNTAQETALFAAKGLKYRPDAVVVFFFINDAELTPKKSVWEPIGRSHLAALYRAGASALLSRFAPSRNYIGYYRGLYAPAAPGWPLARTALTELQSLCAANGIALRVVLLPEFHRLRDYPFREEHARVAAFLSERGIPALDLAPLFSREDDPRRLWVARDDAHPNAAAHRLIAAFTRDFIARAVEGAGSGRRRVQ